MRVPCSNCGGAGKRRRIIRDSEWGLATGMQEDDCPECQGTGRLNVAPLQLYPKATTTPTKQLKSITALQHVGRIPGRKLTPMRLSRKGGR